MRALLSAQADLHTSGWCFDKIVFIFQLLALNRSEVTDDAVYSQHKEEDAQPTEIKSLIFKIEKYTLLVLELGSCFLRKVHTQSF